MQWHFPKCFLNSSNLVIKKLEIKKIAVFKLTISCVKDRDGHCTTKTLLIEGIPKLNPIHASVISQILSEFAEFTEFNEKYAPLRENLNRIEWIVVLILATRSILWMFRLPM